MNRSKITRFSTIIRNFLFSSTNKEFLIFLFFLALSGAFWLIMTLNETYERELFVPVRMTNVPKSVVITGDPDDTVRVAVRDKGFTLLTYETSHRLRPIYINFGTYANRNTGYGFVSPTAIQKLITQQLYGSSKITSVKTDGLQFYFNYGRSKRVPVRLSGRVIPGGSYYLAHTTFNPDSVTVYASRPELDKITAAHTDFIEIKNFQDTIVRRIPLHRMRGVKFVPAEVRVTLYPEILTEESLEVPVSAVNVPTGKVLRMFPSRVKVRFVIGANLFRSIRPADFKVVVDYNDIVANPSDKCTLYLRAFPHSITKPRLDITEVDYLVEQQ